MKSIVIICIGILFFMQSCNKKTYFEKRIINHSNKDLMVIMQNTEFGQMDSVLVRKESDTIIYLEDSRWSKVEAYELCNYTRFTHTIDTIKVLSDDYYVDYFLRFNPKDSSKWEFETETKSIINGKGSCNCELTIWNIDIDQ